MAACGNHLHGVSWKAALSMVRGEMSATAIHALTDTGKVAMLIDEFAQSQAEHTCMLFAARTDVTFIGSPTAGANGDVSNFALPGNLVVTFTGHDVRHPDGRQLQRVGIQPHIRVEPTILGIREGCDEVLEAAVRHLQKRV
jgi:C-terminal processing protease CtpA/Prc